MIDPLSQWISRSSGLHGPVMLMYHAITPGREVPAWPWAVSAARFDAQLDALLSAGWHTVTQSEMLAGGPALQPRSVAITFDDGYADNLYAMESLRSRGMRGTWFIASGSIGRTPQWTEEGQPRGRMLDTGELRAMQQMGIEIGAHSVSHRRLTLLNADELRSEVSDSRSVLEDLLGQSVSSFAYPYGEYDERCTEAVRSAGYSSACTTRTGWAMRDGNPYTLRRLTVFNTDTASTLIRKVSLGSHEIASSILLKQIGRNLAARVSARHGKAE
ncbi:polysaccharide deacetylase family protein [Methyloversatilis sp. XJ19-49]|uniref:polysaccharide deacetylase family protein n=1 Tax=Methyloversatilis sp. XJ19-49 TaxID=2963429 RepID=UPI00211BEE3B|nr:polysaccharide deacetylase family protein [Methyloversatilis sp. XJ19-49]MCQ9377385.1 polysaccharide deacetylase family protein [Methyloversatilis sp. XJ19-49]